jgi:hypothetical protein
MSYWDNRNFQKPEESWGEVILAGLCALGLSVVYMIIIYLCA